jgi:hypothetical protein
VVIKGSAVFSVLVAALAFAASAPAGSNIDRYETKLTMRVELSEPSSTFFHGKVKGGLFACSRDRKVILWREPAAGGAREKVGTSISDDGARWQIPVEDFTPGDYYAQVHTVKFAFYKCLGDKSRKYHREI